MGQTQIQGASNTSIIAEVNSKQQLLTRAIAVSQIHEASLLGKAFSWTAVTADIDAGDTALLVANRDSANDLVICRASFRSDVASQIKIHCPAVATWAGTVVTGNNLNRNFANNALADARADETGNAFVASQVIETLYQGLGVNGQVTTGYQMSVDFKDSIILGYDDAVAADIIAEGGAFEATFVGYYISNSYRS
ncbi:hypothetical protein KAR91_08795 [Candidatus Pacearchaeota archaeon]|nr:hypothetical protein [Candidatus Pacearchaeota archaeon]